MNKINSNKGSTMLIAILAIFIVLSSVMTISVYLNNQLQTTKKTKDSIQSSYLAQAGIETSLSEICRDIDIYLNELDKNIKNSKINYKSSTQTSINIELSNAKTNFKEVYNVLKDTQYSNGIAQILSDINLIKGYTSLEEYNESILKIIDSTLKFYSEIDNDTRKLIEEDLCKGLLSLNKEMTSAYMYNCEVENHEKVQFKETEYSWQGWSVNVPIFDNEVDIIRTTNKDKWHNLIYDINDIGEMLNKPGENPEADHLENLANDLNSSLLSDGGGVKSALQSLRSTLGNNIFNNDEKNIINIEINNVIKEIDHTIKFIDEIEYELYRIYTEYESLIDSEILLGVIQGLENIKYDLIELRCKLGDNSSSQPEEDVDIEENLTETINNPYYTVTFSDNNSNLNINEDKTLSSNINLVVDVDSNGVTQANLEDTYIYIKSEGYSNNSKYKINCKVQFFIEKVGSIFKARYNIVSNEFN